MFRDNVLQPRVSAQKTGILLRTRRYLARANSAMRGLIWLACLAMFLHVVTPRALPMGASATLIDLLGDGQASLCVAAHADRSANSETPGTTYQDDCRQHCLLTQAGALWLPGHGASAPLPLLLGTLHGYDFSSQPATRFVWHAGFSPRDPPFPIG